MKGDPHEGTLNLDAVAGLPAAPAGWTRARLVNLALLVAVPLAVLALATLGAGLLVRVVADWRLGLDPFLPEPMRPRLSLYELALRGVASDVVRQFLIAALVLAAARIAGGKDWYRRLGLTTTGEPHRPILRFWWVWLILLVWPVVHIAWVTGTAKVMHVGFGQGVRLSPFMTQALVAWWIAYVALLAPLAEELLFRGEVFARATGLLSPAWAIATTSLLFCVLHLTQFGLARPLTLIPLAFTLGWLRWRTGRLWPCMLLHAWSNTALLIYLLRPGH